MLTPDKTFIANGVTINQFFLHEHNPNRIALPSILRYGLLGVTIHNTDDLPKVNDDAEQYTRATYNGNMKDVRVHYYVDDVCAWQNLDEKFSAWHAADQRGNGNMRTISIECVMNSKNKNEDIKARDNCARLAAWILYRYGLTEKNLYTHTHWLNVRNGVKGTREQLNVKPNKYKTCPYYIIPEWDKFVNQVAGYIRQLKGETNPVAPKPTPSPNPPTSKLPYLIKILDDTMNIRSDAGTNNPIVCVVKKNEVYTIVKEKKVGNVTWGLLKSFSSAYGGKDNGWISLHEKYVKKM